MNASLCASCRAFLDLSSSLVVWIMHVSDSVGNDNEHLNHLLNIFFSVGEISGKRQHCLTLTRRNQAIPKLLASVPMGKAEPINITHNLCTRLRHEMSNSSSFQPIQSCTLSTFIYFKLVPSCNFI
ncbi:hypothetical protein T02_465 [Trichinella nativa]|uniref:Uncharacterized protein n=1 Tax=Trichinella nativa TaxID=6335 RepID=A0A0V1LJL4_9BILA|nr:hypothetical protein T02_465 [Trichinella nativa]